MDFHAGQVVMVRDEKTDNERMAVVLDSHGDVASERWFDIAFLGEADLTVMRFLSDGGHWDGIRPAFPAKEAS